MRGRLILAIETATADMEVAVSDAAGPLAEVAVRRGRRHVESLHPAVETTCREAGVSLGEVSAVAVDVGPGLFTGLRVGVTAAKMFAVALGVPLLTATSLEILAAAVGALAGPETKVVPVVDMRRGEVAWQWGGEIHLTAPASLAAALAEALAGDDQVAGVLVVGDGARAHRAAILAGVAEAAGGAGWEVEGGWLRVATGEPPAPPARVLASLAFERLAAGVTSDPVALVPLYLREADAAINWESRPGRSPATGAA